MQSRRSPTPASLHLPRPRTPDHILLLKFSKEGGEGEKERREERREKREERREAQKQSDEGEDVRLPLWASMRSLSIVSSSSVRRIPV